MLRFCRTWLMWTLLSTAILGLAGMASMIFGDATRPDWITRAMIVLAQEAPEIIRGMGK